MAAAPARHGLPLSTRYHASAIAEAGNDIANTIPDSPVTEATCSNGKNPSRR